MSEIILDPFEFERTGSSSKTIDVVAFMKLEPHDRERILEGYVNWMQSLAWIVKPFMARPHAFGAQLIFKFPNGFGLSVVFGHCSYGYPNAFEAAPLVWAEEEGDFTLAFEYSDGDVMGHLSVDGVNQALTQIWNISDSNILAYKRAKGGKEKPLQIEDQSILSQPDENTGTF